MHKRVLSKGKLPNTFTTWNVNDFVLHLSEFEQVKYCEILSFYISWVLSTFCNGERYMYLFTYIYISMNINDILVVNV